MLYYNFRYQQAALFLIYGVVIFVYSALIQFLSIYFKHRTSSNLVIRLMEDPSPPVIRKEIVDAENVATANKNREGASYSDRDERIGRVTNCGLNIDIYSYICATLANYT